MPEVVANTPKANTDASAKAFEKLMDEEIQRVEATKDALAQTAAEKLKKIALSYQLNSPNEHIVFGAGGIKFTLGDLRDLFNLHR